MVKSFFENLHCIICMSNNIVSISQIYNHTLHVFLYMVYIIALLHITYEYGLAYSFIRHLNPLEYHNYDNMYKKCFSSSVLSFEFKQNVCFNIVHTPFDVNIALYFERIANNLEIKTVILMMILMWFWILLDICELMTLSHYFFNFQSLDADYNNILQAYTSESNYQEFGQITDQKKFCPGRCSRSCECQSFVYTILTL